MEEKTGLRLETCSAGRLADQLRSGVTLLVVRSSKTACSLGALINYLRCQGIAESQLKNSLATNML